MERCLLPRKPHLLPDYRDKKKSITCNLSATFFSSGLFKARELINRVSFVFLSLVSGVVIWLQGWNTEEAERNVRSISYFLSKSLWPVVMNFSVSNITQHWLYQHRVKQTVARWLPTSSGWLRLCTREINCAGKIELICKEMPRLRDKTIVSI